MAVLSRQLEEPLFIKKEAAQTPSFDAYQTPAQFSTQGGTLIEGTFPGIKAIRESIQQKSFEPVKRFAAESPILQPARTPQEVFERTLSLGLTAPGELIRFKGFKDLTTKFLDYSKGKSTLSRQEILDFAKRPELKKGEANLLNRLGSEIKDAKIPAQEFADSMRRELLELKPVKVKEPQYYNTSYNERVIHNTSDATRFGKNYEEVVFEAPFNTGGDPHYPNSQKLFAWTRGDEVVESRKKIWREQEIQSPLQKEGLETMREISNQMSRKGIDTEATKAANLARQKELEQLQPFTNDRFGERIMRERIKEKAQKGYEKYRLPTGETIGKIEGFEIGNWSTLPDNGGFGSRLNPNDLKVGMQVQHNNDTEWIITDILGDGRFKAVPQNVKDAEKSWITVKDTYTPPSNQKYLARNSNTGEVVQFSTPKEADKYIEEQIKRSYEQYSETFDLTGKSNPQYIRYEKWGKFLKNKYGAKIVTDPQGNSWFEIDLKPEYKKLPIEAFGIAPFLPRIFKTEQKEEEPLFIK